MAELEREEDAATAAGAGQGAIPTPEPQYVVSNGEDAWEQGDILAQVADAQERRRLVARVQSRLAELGHDPGPVDGLYGPLTRAAVAGFQETAGLDADGQITLTMLNALTMAGAADEEPAPSDLVAEAQLLLGELGFEAGPSDGIAGEQTEAAVRAYQRVVGLAEDGRINEALVAHLIAAREMQLEEGAPAAPVVTSGEEIDEEDIARALERTLIEEGGILLPPWVLQATPGFRYTHDSSDELRIVNVGGLASVAQQDRRSDIGQASLTLRLGLPWDTQVETFIPYVVAHEDVVTAQTFEQERDGHGLGDVEFAVTKQILREGEWIPNVLTSIGWKTDTGETEFDPNSDNLSTGTGYHGLNGNVTLTKSKDPFVFFGNLGYTYNFSHEIAGTDVEPGNEIDVGIGAILAAGPDTSLRVTQRQTFINETALDGSDVAGSDQVQSIFEVGGSVVLSANALFDVALGIGLTDDSPDYQIEATLPIRF